MERIPLDNLDLTLEVPTDQLLDLNDALSRLEVEFPEKAEVVQLRFFWEFDFQPGESIV